MNTLESTFWKLLRSHLPKGTHHQRIETGSVGTGIPDVNVCLEGIESWWELKVVKGKRVELSPEQSAWAFRRWRSGGRTFIVARDKYDKVRKGRADKIYIWRGSAGPAIIEHGIEAPDAITFDAPFDWGAIMALLTGKADLN